MISQIKILRNWLRKLRRQSMNNSLQWTLLMILLFMLVFNLLGLYLLSPSTEDSYYVYVESMLNIPLPVQLQAPKRKETIQDRFKYSLKELKSQAEANILQQIRHQWLKPPPGVPFNRSSLRGISDEGSVWTGRVSRRVQDLLLPIETNGFYVEYGASDGYTGSFTFQFDFRNWSGLLIEADPLYFQKLTKFGRNTWTINCCLSIHPKAEKHKMLRYSSIYYPSVMEEFAINGTVEYPKLAGVFEAQCFPLISILLAANVVTVDFLCLKSEGAALHILKTHMWHLVHIKVILIVESHRHGDKAESIHTVLSGHGYVSRGLIPSSEKTAYIYVHESHLQNEPPVMT